MIQETPSPPVSGDSQPYLAPAVPGSISLFDLFLLLLPLFLGGGLRQVLGLADLLGGLCHGAAATAAADPVAVAPALLWFALPPVVPVSSFCVPLSPEPRPYFSSGGHHDMSVCEAGSVCVRMPIASTRQPPAATEEDATASGADAAACAAAATDPVSLHCTELPPLPLLSFLPSSLPSSLLPLPLLAQNSHAVWCSAQWRCCCRAPSFYLSNDLVALLLC